MRKLLTEFLPRNALHTSEVHAWAINCVCRASVRPPYVTLDCVEMASVHKYVYRQNILLWCRATRGVSATTLRDRRSAQLTGFCHHAFSETWRKLIFDISGGWWSRLFQSSRTAPPLSPEWELCSSSHFFCLARPWARRRLGHPDDPTCGLQECRRPSFKQRCRPAEAA